MTPILTRPEQRVKWLTSQDRPLTEDEADELYVNLKRMEYRERRNQQRAALLVEEMAAEALERHEAEEAQTLARIERESRKRDLQVRHETSFKDRLAAVQSGKATICTMPVRNTLGGLVGWAA
jgi:hypothetical protein